MYHRQCLRFLNAIIFSFAYIHKGMTSGLVCRKVLTYGLVRRKVLRNSLFEFQGESQGRTKAQDTPHTFCIAIADYLDQVSNLVGLGIFELTSNDLCTLLLYGNEQFDTVNNRAIIEATVQFIQRSKRLKRN